MGEFRIRDLNDEINKLLREKKHWEERILELGGPDYEVRGGMGEGRGGGGIGEGRWDRGGGGGGDRGGEGRLPNHFCWW